MISASWLPLVHENDNLKYKFIPPFKVNFQHSQFETKDSSEAAKYTLPKFILFSPILLFLQKSELSGLLVKFGRFQ